MNEQLLKTSGADVLASRKKLRKPRNGVASTPLYVRGLILFLLFLDKNKNTRKKNNAMKAWKKENLKITKSQHWYHIPTLCKFFDSQPFITGLVA